MLPLQIRRGGSTGDGNPFLRRKILSTSKFSFDFGGCDFDVTHLEEI